MTPAAGGPSAAEYKRTVFAEERCQFQRIEDGHYRFALPDFGIEFIVDRMRRKWDEAVGEVTVRCALPGARTFEGVLSVGDLNLSSQRARQDRARYLAERARTDSSVDWMGLLDEFIQRVLAAERTGQPAVLLRDLPRPRPDDTLYAEGLHLPARHPAIAFGDGGAGKSYLALYVAGTCAQKGLRVGVFDWELAAEDFRERGERIWPDLPGILYARCTRPLALEVDRLRRIVRDERLDYAIFDSVGFACDGPPEAAEVAGRYFQSVRRLGIGGLHIAHVSKAEGADQKPFGSTFWHNGARATWFVKVAEAVPNSGAIMVGLYNRKSNLSALRPAVGFEITFSETVTRFRRVNVADTPDLAGQLSTRQRMAHVLRRGAMTPKALADEVQADIETVKRTARRYRETFTLIPGGSLALLERRS